MMVKIINIPAYPHIKITAFSEQFTIIYLGLKYKQLQGAMPTPWNIIRGSPVHPGSQGPAYRPMLTYAMGLLKIVVYRMALDNKE